MLRAERRRRGDKIAAGALVVLALLGVGLAWRFSDAAATTSVTGPGGATVPPAPSSLPASLSQAWRAPSAATPTPVVVGPTVVSADGSEVIGRDPVTGEQRWSYTRNLPLCTVGSGFNRTLAAYRHGSYCSEVTSLNAETGARGPQRNPDLGLGARLLDSGSAVLAASPDYLEVWRSDLVRTLEYGNVPTPEQPGRQPRAGCRFGSVAMVIGRLGVLERCPGDAADRLTVLRSDSKEADQPEQEFSIVLPEKGARLVAVSTDREAVLLPNPARLQVFDAAGVPLASYPLELPTADLAGDPPGGQVAVSTDAQRVYWWTGSQTIALDRSDLRPVWTVPGTLGPGTTFAGSLLLPVPGGLAVIDERGTAGRTVPVDRGGYTGPVGLASLGPVLLEQRGSELVALR